MPQVLPACIGRTCFRVFLLANVPRYINLQHPWTSSKEPWRFFFLGASKPSIAEIAALADAVAGLPISSPLAERVEEAVAAAEAWQERARRLLAKRNSGQKLSKCLHWVQSSLDRALEQLKLRLEVRLIYPCQCCMNCPGI